MRRERGHAGVGFYPVDGLGDGLCHRLARPFAGMVETATAPAPFQGAGAAQLVGNTFVLFIEGCGAIEIVCRARAIAVGGDLLEPAHELLLCHGVEERFVRLELGRLRIVAGRERHQLLRVYRAGSGVALKQQRDITETAAVFHHDRPVVVCHLPVVSAQRQHVPGWRRRLRRFGRLDRSSLPGRIFLLPGPRLRGRSLWLRDGRRQAGPQRAAGKRPRSRSETS
jgi:hypothetical protein